MKAVWAFKTHTHSVRTLKIQSHLDQWKTRAIDTSESKAWWIIEPGSTLRLVWDTTTSFLMLVMVFYVPYHVSFVRSSMAYDVFDQVVTVWFTVDIVLSFITAYEKDGVLVTRPEKIAFHYLRTFFLIDLVATVPWEVLFDETSAGKIAEYGRLSKAAKIPRLLRYVRAVKFFRTTYGGSAEGQIYGFYARMNPGILSLGEYLVIISLFA